MPYSRTRKSSAKTVAGSNLPPAQASGSVGTRATPACFSCFSLRSQVQSDPAETNQLAPDARNMQSTSENAPNVSINGGSVSVAQSNPEGLIRVVPEALTIGGGGNVEANIIDNAKAAAGVVDKLPTQKSTSNVAQNSPDVNPARASSKKNTGSTIAVVPNALKEGGGNSTRKSQRATSLDELPTKRSPRGGSVEEEAGPAATKKSLSGVGKEGSATTTVRVHKPRRASTGCRDESPTKGRSSVDELPTKKSSSNVPKEKVARGKSQSKENLVQRIHSLPSSSSQQEPPVAYHIQFQVSEEEEDAAVLEPIGEKCGICGIDLAFMLAGFESTSRGETQVHAVLPCGHCFHNTCLEFVLDPSQPTMQTPPCSSCSS